MTREQSGTREDKREIRGGNDGGTNCVRERERERERERDVWT